MNKKKIFAALGLALLVIIVISLVVRKNSTGKGYVLDKNNSIKLKDIETYYKRVDFNDGTVKDYFSDKIINPYTLKFFQSLEKKFSESKDLDSHLDSVRQYLYSVMPTADADRLMAVYETYMKYQMSLAEKTKLWGTPATAEEALDFLRKVHQYRRDTFGKENADALFGVSVKAEEYPIRRGMVVYDEKLYGAEKEKRLKELNREMWGDEAGAVEEYTNTYNRYLEKQAMYKRDLAEMRSEEERQAKIKEFRQELFTPEQVARLDDVDKQIESEKKKETDYLAQESRIKSDPNLDSAGKEEKIKSLQDQVFGDEADAFRRRQAIEKGMEQYKGK